LFAYAVVLMIIAGYMGAVSVVTTVKWFWFLFGMAMFLPVVYSLARTFRETVITRKDAEIIELYGKVAWLTIIIWSFYPIVWLFSEGFASFSVSFEVRFSPAFICDDCPYQLVRLNHNDIIAPLES
jgi:bacteriorhodopsin